MDNLCRSIREQLSEYMDFRLQGENRARCERHLATCADCRAAFESMQALQRSVKTLPAAPPPEAFYQRVFRAAEQASEKKQTPRFHFGKLAVSFAAIGFVVLAVREAHNPDFPFSALTPERRKEAPAPVLLKTSHREEIAVAKAKDEKMLRMDEIAAASPAPAANEPVITGALDSLYERKPEASREESDLRQARAGESKSQNTRQTTVFEGTAVRGVTYMRRFARSYELRLKPIAYGWEIQVIHPGRPGQNLARFSADTHGESLYIEGWHFRSRAPSAPGRQRHFIFSQQADTPIGGSDAQGVALPQQIATIRQDGSGLLEITELTLSPVRRGEKALIHSMKFRVTITWQEPS